MSTIRRIFVEKKDAFAVEAHGLLSDLRNNLGMKNLDRYQDPEPLRRDGRQR